MYEHTLTHMIHNSVQNLCRRYSLKKVNRLLIKVGGIRKINPELMTFIFAGLSKGTPAEGAVMSVMILPVSLKCYSCGHTWTTDEAEFLCPRCSGRNVDLLSGLEFAIDFIEVESNVS